AYAIDRGAFQSDRNSREIFDLYAVRIRDRSPVLLAKNVLMSFVATTLTWSNDSTKLAFVGGTVAQDSSGPVFRGFGATFGGRLYVVDINKPNVLTAIGSQNLDRIQDRLLWSSGDREIYALSQDRS